MEKCDSWRKNLRFFMWYTFLLLPNIGVNLEKRVANLVRFSYKISLLFSQGSVVEA